MNPDDIELDPVRLLTIIREENPQTYELAVRRAVIEQQREIITRLAAAVPTTPAEPPAWTERHDAAATNGEAVPA